MYWDALILVNDGGGCEEMTAVATAYKDERRGDSSGVGGDMGDVEMVE